jgi:hypothetical protein
MKPGKAILLLGQQHRVVLVVGRNYVLGTALLNDTKLAKMHVDYTHKLDRTFPDAATTGLQKIHFAHYGYGTTDTTWYVDNIKIRKYAATEPTAAFASEETHPDIRYGPVAHWKFDEGQVSRNRNTHYLERNNT